MKEIKYDHLMEILERKKQYALNKYEENKNTSKASYYMGYFDMIWETVEYFELMELDKEDEFIDIEEPKKILCNTGKLEDAEDRIAELSYQVTSLIKNQKYLYKKLKEKE